MNTFAASYLQAGDLSDTEDTVLTIRRIEKTEMPQDDRIVTKWILYFDEIESRLVVNDKNGRSISKLHGSDMDLWVNKRISLYLAPVVFRGDHVNGIRVRPHVPA